MKEGVLSTIQHLGKPHVFFFLLLRAQGLSNRAMRSGSLRFSVNWTSDSMPGSENVMLHRPTMLGILGATLVVPGD